MAKQRLVNTRLWSDNWIRRINPLDRYLFLYLLTNEHTNISGIYELPITTMAFETGIDERDLEKSMLPKLEPKVYYIDGWICIKNFQKHQSGDSEKIKIGIKSEMDRIPQEIKKKINDTLSIPYVYPMDTPRRLSVYSNSNPNLTKDSAQKCTTEEKPWIYQEKWDEMMNSGKPIDKILAVFWKKRGLLFENTKQLSAQYKRDCKAAKQVLDSGYSEKQIINAFEYVIEHYNDIKWTLETILKVLPEANK